MRTPPNIALLGADDPLGEALLRQVTERDVAIGEIFPLSLSESEGCVTARGEELPLLDVADFDWGRADVLLNATRAGAAARFEEAARKSGCQVIGLGAGAGTTGRIAVEGALSIAVHRVLAALRQEARIDAVSIVALFPVAEAGEAGMAELAEQTRALFSMEEREPEVFPLRIAFNLIPQVGPTLSDGHGRLEQEATEEIRTLLGQPDLAISVTAVWAPLFYGAAASLHVSTQGERGLDDLKERLSGKPGITLMDTGLPGGVATPATDAQDSDAVFLSRLRPGADPKRDVAMWLVIDTTRLEATRMADLLENLIEK